MKSNIYDYAISATGKRISEEEIKTALEKLGLEDIQVECLLNFDEYVQSLPDEELPGLVDACLDWIRHYGIGGGDYSTEACMRDGCEECESDNPRIIAKAMYGKICGYSKTSFQSAAMVHDCLTEAMGDIKNE